MDECKIVGNGIVVNQNGTGYFDFVIGTTPLTGEESVQRYSFTSLEGLVNDLVGLRSALIAPETFPLLPLSNFIAGDPLWTQHLANAEGATATVDMPGGEGGSINFG